MCLPANRFGMIFVTNPLFLFDLKISGISFQFYLDNKDVIPELTKKIKAGTDQTIVNFLVKKYNVDMTYLPECYNLQDLFRKNLLHIPGHSWFSDDLHYLDNGWVYHFNAIPQNDRHVSYWMERSYKQLYS